MHAAKFDRSNVHQQWQRVLDYCRAERRLPVDAPEGLSNRGLFLITKAKLPPDGRGEPR